MSLNQSFISDFSDHISLSASFSVIYVLWDPESKSSLVSSLRELFGFFTWVVAVCIRTISPEEISTFSSTWLHSFAISLISPTK